MFQSGGWKKTLLALLFLAAVAQVQAGERGPIPIACFSQNTGGGTGNGNLIVTFDPACTYLPLPTSTLQRFAYRLTWDFGDATAPVTVPAIGLGTTTSALAKVSHIYTAVDVNIVYTVTLRVDVIIISTVDGSVAEGPSHMVTGEVQLATANIAPDPSLLNVTTSASNGAVPYTVTVQPNLNDPDGRIVYALLDWGDGTSTRITPIPANVNDPPVTFQHTYTAAGNYTIQLFAIDNGRLPLTAVLPSTVGATDDPELTLAEITAFHDGSVTPAVQFQPVLGQDSFLLVVLGNMRVRSGKFNLKFKEVARDSFSVQLEPTLFAESTANATVALRIGAGTLQTVNGVPRVVAPAFTANFTTDGKGRFKDSSQGLSFDFNGRKKRLTIKLGRATLAPALGVADATVVNGFVDVPVVVTLNQTVLSTTARFVLNSTQFIKAIGKKARTFPLGL